MKKIKNTLHVIIITLCIFTIAIPTFAQETQDTGKPRTFALGITTLKEHGFGAMLRLRFNHIAFDASAGYVPWLIMYEESSSDSYSSSSSTGEIDTGMGYQYLGSMVIFFNDQMKRFQNGIRASYLVSEVAGPGYGLGWVGELTWDRFALGFGLGMQYYPQFEDKVREYFDIASNVEIPESTRVQFYLGVNLTWYLF